MAAPRLRVPVQQPVEEAQQLHHALVAGPRCASHHIRLSARLGPLSSPEMEGEGATMSDILCAWAITVLLGYALHDAPA